MCKSLREKRFDDGECLQSATASGASCAQSTCRLAAPLLACQKWNSAKLATRPRARAKVERHPTTAAAAAAAKLKAPPRVLYYAIVPAGRRAGLSSSGNGARARAPPKRSRDLRRRPRRRCRHAKRLRAKVGSLGEISSIRLSRRPSRRVRRRRRRRRRRRETQVRQLKRECVSACKLAPRALVVCSLFACLLACAVCRELLASSVAS